MKILIADDHAYNRELLSFILEDEGFEWVEATNGKEALDRCLNDPSIGLVLMDVTMPEMDGIAATAAIKQQLGTRILPIIFVTALDNDAILTKCLDAGGDDFVPKPTNEAVLLAKIKAHRRTQELNRDLQEANRQLAFHKENTDREHAIVERIFEKGSRRIKTRCVNARAYSSPMSMFDGDIILEAPSPSGGVYHIVGDFTGHGLAASIGSLPVTEIFYRMASQQASIGLLAKELNKTLNELLPMTMFFCASLTYLDATGSQLSLWAGGMNDLIITDGEKASLETIVSEHMPLGILSDAEFDETPRQVSLRPSQRVYIYTDGVNEAVNKDNEEFGLERIEHYLSGPADTAFDRLMDALHDFQHGGDRSDDISLLEIRAGTLEHRSKDDDSVVDMASRAHQAESFPWEFSMRLGRNELRNTRIVDQLMEFIGGIEGIELHREKIFTIISELYSNALEHGVLGLDSLMKDSADGFEEYYRLRAERLDALGEDYVAVKVLFEKGRPNTLAITITDSGPGFDAEAKLRELDENGDAYGRGLPLLKHLCCDLRYCDGGRTVEAHYSLCL